MTRTGINMIQNPQLGDVWYVSEEGHSNHGDFRYLVTPFSKEGAYRFSRVPSLNLDRGNRANSGYMDTLVEMYSPKVPKEEELLLKFNRISIILLKYWEQKNDIHKLLIELDI